MKTQAKTLLSKVGLLEPIRKARRSLVSHSPQLAREYARRCGASLQFTPRYVAIRKNDEEIRISKACASGAGLPSFLEHWEWHHSSVEPESIDGRRIVDLSRPRVHRLTKSGQELELSFEDTIIRLRKNQREIRINALHPTQAWDVGNAFEYFFSAVEPEARGGIAVVDYSARRVHRLARSGLEFEFPSLPEADESTEVYLTSLGIKPGDFVLDLGAYAGASAYFLAKAVGPDGLVASFEPDAANFRSLAANIERHGLTNVMAVPKGVWQETTTLAFQAEGSMSSSIADVVGRSSNVTTIEVLSLDEAAALGGTRRVAAIKMDIEGAELAVLRGAEAFLRKHRPRITVEPHWVQGQTVGADGMDTEEVCAILRSYDYTVEVLAQGLLHWPLVAASPNPESRRA